MRRYTLPVLVMAYLVVLGLLLGISVIPTLMGPTGGILFRTDRTEYVMGDTVLFQVWSERIEFVAAWTTADVARLADGEWLPVTCSDLILIAMIAPGTGQTWGWRVESHPGQAIGGFCHPVEPGAYRGYTELHTGCSDSDGPCSNGPFRLQIDFTVTF